MQIGDNSSTASNDRALKRLILYLLISGDLENQINATKILSTLHNVAIYKVKLEPIVQFKSYHIEILFWSKFDISKCWCDLEIRSRSPQSNQLLTIYLCKFG